MTNPPSLSEPPSRTSPKHAGEQIRRPNIVLLLSDQHSIGHIGAHGNRHINTPHIDSIVRGGVSFMNSYCTSPQCAPARSSIHTGRMPHITGVNHNKNDNQMNWTLPNMGDAVRDAGYATAWSGKLHLGGEKTGDTSTPTPPGMCEPPHYTLSYYPTAPDGIPGFENLNYSGVMKDYARVGSRPRSYRSAFDVDAPAVEEAIAFIEREHSRPFFLVVSILNPHDICFWPMRPAWRSELPPLPTDISKLPPLPANHCVPKGEVASLAGAREVIASGWHAILTKRRWREYIHVYNSLIEHCDQSVGAVLSALHDARLEDDTVVIYTSDHGDGAAAHQLRGKHLPYEESVAVPFVIRWNGVIPEGVKDTKHLVSSLDLFRTVCDYAGASVAESVEGSSIRAVIDAPSQVGRLMVPIEIGRHPNRNNRNLKTDCRIIRTLRHKYLRFNTGEEMLFDMEEDRGEMINLADDPGFDKTKLENRERLSQYIAETADHFVI